MPFLDYKNIQIQYTSQGLGSVFVLLHGFLESSTMWNNITPILAKKHRVISIDLLGHGLSENLSYVHTMEEQAEMVKTVLDKLRLRRYTLIGHSMGGYIALAFANKYAKNIKHLVLMNSTALPDSTVRLANRDRAIKMIKKNKETFIKMAIPNLFSEESRSLYSAEINTLKEEANQITIQGITAAIEGMKVRKNYSILLKQSNFLITFIAGKKDTVLNYIDLVEQTKDTLVDFISLENGHMSHIEDKLAIQTILTKI
jgi:pimeloyl-ACP methyl ester carboxylesterase